MLAEQAPTGRPETIADTEWRLLRIPTLESGYYALGRHELAAECAHESNDQVRAVMLEALIDCTYKKDLRNLALQERRLRTNSPSSSPNSPNCKRSAMPSSSSAATD